MEYETIDADQVADLMARRKVRPPRDWHDDDSDDQMQGQSQPTAEPPEGGEPRSNPIGGPANNH